MDTPIAAIAVKDYPVNPSNSYFFSVGSMELSLTIAPDDFGSFSLMIMKRVGSAYGATAPYIDSSITNETIMQYGSVYNYLVAMLPKCNEQLQRVAGVIAPPNQSDKVANVGYDLAMQNIVCDSTHLTFSLANPPLSHASLPQG